VPGCFEREVVYFIILVPIFVFLDSSYHILIWYVFIKESISTPEHRRQF
jgi:hypothetical protein